ncbi:N-acetylmuramoyl-L-alanine amidase [Roseburia sp. 499]|uniref:N-acetylmuramoyl-L-alanine amidase n=1 Tax=Roseburia sp. 499 TaxID=1261634 RepID=UPI0009512C9F|nr:N-acetylmuramoyl-L-alanine amidase [Roseburia sp. 499]WVK69119.1 N-acetylmuramoyl-L-alanine amidase [Roseburia sp. 499]
MEPTIMIDSGHGGMDNGAVYMGRKEKDDNLRIGLAVGERLEKAGYHVLYTRNTDVYDTPLQKAQKANNAGADYFFSFHRNSGEIPNTYSGAQALVYADNTRAYQIGENIMEQLIQLGFKDLGVEERPGLVVLRRTNMPAVLLELGFINNDEDNRIFDEQFDQMADAIVRGIEQSIPLAPVKKQYGVQVGLFRYQSNAEYLKEELENIGYTVVVRREEPYYAVVVGRETTLEDATNLQNQLRQQGYDTLVVSM